MVDMGQGYGHRANREMSTTIPGRVVAQIRKRRWSAELAGLFNGDLKHLVVLEAQIDRTWSVR